MEIIVFFYYVIVNVYIYIILNIVCLICVHSFNDVFLYVGIEETRNIDELPSFFNEYSSLFTSFSSKSQPDHTTDTYIPNDSITSSTTTSTTTSPSSTTSSTTSITSPPKTPKLADSGTLIWYDPRKLTDAKVSPQIRDTVNAFVKNFKPKQVI